MSFDPYYKWLGIPSDEQPANHYRLLGVRDFEEDRDVIENAADQRMSHVRNFQSGKYADQSQELLNELAAARVVLLSPAKRQAYDDELEIKLKPKVEAQPIPALAAPIAVPQVPASQSQGYGIQPLDDSPGTDVSAAARRSKFRRRQTPVWLLPAAIGGALVVFLAIFLIARLSGQPEAQPIAQNDPAPVDQPVKETDATPQQNTPTNSPLGSGDVSTPDAIDPEENNARDNNTQSGSEGAAGTGTSTTPAIDIPETPVTNTGEPLTSDPESGALHYSFTSAAELEDFTFTGDYRLLPGGGLDLLDGKPASWADTIQEFSYPLRIDCEVSCKADGLLDIIPGFGPIRFGWGLNYNKDMVTIINGVRTKMRHRKIVADQLYHVAITIDSHRKLRIAIDGSPVFLAQLDDDLELAGKIQLSGGIGHVVYKSVTIFPDWQGESATTVPLSEGPSATVGTPTEQTVYDFSDRTTARFFQFDDQYILQFGELHIYSEQPALSQAFSRKEFAYPLELRYQLHCLPQRTAHVALGFGPIRLLWSLDKNTTTALEIGDAHINVPHMPVVPAHTYKVSMAIDAERILRVRIDDKLLFEDNVPTDIELTGPLVLGAGLNGWVAYDGAIVLPLNEE